MQACLGQCDLPWDDFLSFKALEVFIDATHCRVVSYGCKTQIFEHPPCLGFIRWNDQRRNTRTISNYLLRGWWDRETGSAEHSANSPESGFPTVICIANDADGNDPFELILTFQGSHSPPEIVYSINVYNLETGNPGVIQQGFKETFVIRPFNNEKIVCGDFNIPGSVRH